MLCVKNSGEFFADSEELTAENDCLQRGGETEVLFLQTVSHLVQQRFVGELHGSAERVSQQLAAELADDGVASCCREVDPQVVEAFFKIREEIREISQSNSEYNVLAV